MRIQIRRHKDGGPPKAGGALRINKGEGEITFDKEGEHRDTAVHTAVRCSMSIPYFFQPQWVDNRRVYDGGLLHNYPVQIFLDQEGQRNLRGPTAKLHRALPWVNYAASTKPRFGAGGPIIHMNSTRMIPKVIDRYRSQTILIDTEPIGTIDSILRIRKGLLSASGTSAALSFLRTVVSSVVRNRSLSDELAQRQKGSAILSSKQGRAPRSISETYTDGCHWPEPRAERGWLCSSFLNRDPQFFSDWTS